MKYEVNEAERILFIGQSKRSRICMLCADWARSWYSLSALLIFFGGKRFCETVFFLRRNTNCQQTTSKPPVLEGIANVGFTNLYIFGLEVV